MIIFFLFYLSLECSFIVCINNSQDLTLANIFVFWIVPLRRTSYLSPLVNLQITFGMSSQYIGFSRELGLWVRVGPRRCASEAGLALTPVYCLSIPTFIVLYAEKI